jgi:hypothetical protein
LDSSGGGGVVLNDGQVANALVVETKVLSKGLRAEKFETAFNKVANSESVMDWIATGKALVSRVKEWEQLLLLNDVSQLDPLFLGRVTASGVVGASVEDDDSTFWGGFEVRNETIEVNLTGLGIPVAVVTTVSEASTEEDFLVVFPCSEGF